MKTFRFSQLFLLTLASAVSIGAQAGSSVSLYGMVNVAVQKKGTGEVEMMGAEHRYGSAFGITGEEALGKGYSAIFKLEAELAPDNGSGRYGKTKTEFGFNNESWVGLLTPVGAFRFGGSTTPIVNMWVGGDYAPGRGIGEFTGGLTGAGLREDQPEAGVKWNNGFFYDMELNGLGAGFAITTKGSQSVIPTDEFHDSVMSEGSTGKRPAFGAYARYDGKIGANGRYKIGAVFQRDNGTSYSTTENGYNAPAESKHTWGLAAGYGYGPVTLTAGFARAKIDNTMFAISPLDVLPVEFGGNGNPDPAVLRTGRSDTLFVALKGQITPNDSAYISYGKYKRSHKFDTGGLGSADGGISGRQLSIGYEHNLSKRTTLYVDARRVSGIKNTCEITSDNSDGMIMPALCQQSVSTVDDVLKTEKGYSWDIGVAHKF